jgi:hypothetical protein
VAELPDHLREIFVEVAHRAASNVFQAALAERVDFVVLAGDVIDASLAGPRGVLFLREQFALLAEKNIAVYWAGGAAECLNAWPKNISWPANVAIFSADQPAVCEVVREGRSICTLVGQSRSIDTTQGFALSHAAGRVTAESPFVIGVVYGDYGESELRAQAIDYWAMGGQHDLTLPVEGHPMIHYPGTPQGRSYDEPGSHGCTLVEVTEQREIRTRPVIADVLRYETVRLKLPADSTPAHAAVERRLREALLALADANVGVAVVAHAIVAADEAVDFPWRNVALATIVATLRGEFGYAASPVWLDKVSLLPPTLPESWLKYENLLGDFLRAAQELERSPADFDPSRYIPTSALQEPLMRLVTPGDRESARRTVREAASLGAQLLHSGEARP